MKTPAHTYDILIAGSGFSGSLCALIFHQLGYKVALVEKGSHPRFAIGESSTPIADMVLRDLAKNYDLPWLRPFSRYGSWQETYPEVGCGLKRGFSYYKHFPQTPFATNADHANELLVAASSSDQQSDTHWFREDLDAFLVTKVKEVGIPYWERAELLGAKDTSPQTYSLQIEEDTFGIQAHFFLDASGGPQLLQNLWGVPSTSEGFQTSSQAFYTHLEDVLPWTDYLKEKGIPTDEHPYDPDYSALHQLLEEGWVWMLRFKDQKLSTGLVLPCPKDGSETPLTQEHWEQVLAQYPSLQQQLKQARLAEKPGKWIGTERLQRKAQKGVGTHWAALPHTMGFVDPMHSTGIAHTLCGVEKLAHLLHTHWQDPKARTQALEAYEASVKTELELIDLLVAGCYKTLPYFELFTAWTMVYFTTAIAYEQQRLQGHIPHCFLEADDPKIAALVQEAYHNLITLLEKGEPSPTEQANFVNSIRRQIAPYNIAGLLDPKARNMYRHTAAEL